jgi:glycosyltransferase involved in cell wall biosynthesis
MLVYGTEAPQDEYRHLYAQCRSTDGIDYVGSLSQPELARQMAAVSVLAYPNTFPETCCIAALEALAAGAFVVTTELGALPETCAGFGRLVQPRPTEYVGDFIAAVCEVLAAFKSDRASFTARQFQQAEAFNRAQTWDLRALDWERAAARWLAQRRG